LIKLARRGMSMNVGGADGYAPMISCDDAARAVVAALDAPAGAYNVVDDDPMTRRQLDAAMAAAVGGQRMLRPPKAALRAAGEDAKIFLLSNRPSNQRFKAATGWAPKDRSTRDGFIALDRAIPGEATSLLQSIALGILCLSSLLVGVYATFFPRAFYDDFPIGRGWVAADGPYNEHLMRDFGGLNLGLGFVALVAAVVGGAWLVRAAAGGSLLFAVPHFVYHVRHRHAFDGVDTILSPGTLFMTIVLAVLVLVLNEGRSTKLVALPPQREVGATNL